MLATLMKMALALIIAAQGANIPADLKTQALQVAQAAIEYVQSHTDTVPPVITPEATSTPVTPTAPTIVYIPYIPPNYGTVLPQQAAPTVDKSDIVVTVGAVNMRSQGKYGEYPIKVSVLGSNGATVKRAPITFQRPSDDMSLVWNGAPSSLNTMTHTGDDPDYWYTDLGYVPSTTGEKTLTFTSGNLTKTLSIQVKPVVSVDAIATGNDLNTVVSLKTINNQIGTVSFSPAERPLYVKDMTLTMSGQNLSEDIIAEYALGDGTYRSVLLHPGTNKIGFGGTRELPVTGEWQNLVILSNAPSKPGAYTLTINGLSVFDDLVGTRTIQGFPITFHYTVQ